MKKPKLELYLSAITVAAIFIAWFISTSTGSIDQLFIPSPKSVWESFTTVLRDGYKGSTLLQHLGTSMKRLVIAYLLCVVTAVPIGLLSGYNSKVRALLEPIIEFYRPLPPLAYYTILTLWMGIDEESKLALLYLAGFAPIYISCVAGVIRIKEDYINGALALGVEYTTLVAAEMVAATAGIGWMVLDASKYLRSDIVFMGVIIMGITGILLDKIIQLIEKQLIHWKGRN